MSFKIGDIAETNKKSLTNFKEQYETIHYLNTGNLNEGTINELEYYNIDDEKIPSRAKRVVDKDDILYSTVRPKQKHYGIIREKKENLIVSTGFAVLSPNKELVYPEYLYRFLTQEPVIEYLHNVAETSTSAYPSITPDVIEKIDIKLPPLKEQKVIANTLCVLDEKIELNNQMNETLEEMAQAIYKSWFVDFEPFQDEEFIDSELGKIPEEWEVGILKDIVSMKNGKRPEERKGEKDKEFKVPVVGASSVMAYTEKELYNEPILVIGRVGTLGVVQRFNTPCWTSDNTIVIKPDYYEYVYQVLNEINFKNLNRGSTQPLIAQKDIKGIKIVIPPEDILNQFEIKIAKLSQKINLNKKENQTLTQLKNALLPKLMSGEIRVPIED